MLPGRHGGNIDANLLTVGATLYLPVQVEGALAYVGDPHFAQGDGEVSLTAMEASLRARSRWTWCRARTPYDDSASSPARSRRRPTTRPDRHGRGPRRRGAELRAAIALRVVSYGMDPRMAYAYLSAATDFDSRRSSTW
jgi:hypothetical protein